MIRFDAKPALALLLGLTLACEKQEASTEVAAEDTEAIEPIPADRQAGALKQKAGRVNPGRLV